MIFFYKLVVVADDVDDDNYALTDFYQRYTI